jgi:hypothetical protein
VISGTNWENLAVLLGHEVSVRKYEAAMIQEYMAVNKLVANAEKTKVLLIRGKRHKKWPEVKIKVFLK